MLSEVLNVLIKIYGYIPRQIKFVKEIPNKAGAYLPSEDTIIFTQYSNISTVRHEYGHLLYHRLNVDWDTSEGFARSFNLMWNNVDTPCVCGSWKFIPITSWEETMKTGLQRIKCLDCGRTYVNRVGNRIMRLKPAFPP